MALRISRLAGGIMALNVESVIDTFVCELLARKHFIGSEGLMTAFRVRITR